MKNVVCRLPYSIRVPMYLGTVLIWFLIERGIKAARLTGVLVFIGIVLLYFWVSLSANSLFFFLR